MRFQNVNRFRNVSSIPIGQNLAKSRNLYGTSFHEILLIIFLVLGSGELTRSYFAKYLIFGLCQNFNIRQSSCNTTRIFLLLAGNWQRRSYKELLCEILQQELPKHRFHTRLHFNNKVYTLHSLGKSMLWIFFGWKFPGLFYLGVNWQLHKISLTRLL